MQYFVTNSFMTLCSNFYQNRPSFVEDVTNILAYFFLVHGVLCVIIADVSLTVQGT